MIRILVLRSNKGITFCGGHNMLDMNIERKEIKLPIYKIFNEDQLLSIATLLTGKSHRRQTVEFIDSRLGKHLLTIESL